MLITIIILVLSAVFFVWQDTVGSCGSLCFSGFVDFSDIDS